MTMPPSTLLQTVPVEIFALILDEVKRESFRSLQNLRLVSKEFNFLVEPLAFSSVTFFRYNLQSSEFLSQLECLASGNSVNSRHTKRLRICEQTFPPLEKHAGNPLPWERKSPEEIERTREDALMAQRNYLAGAIGALVHVTHVLYHLRETEAYDAVLIALAQLPSLEHLSLSFCSDFDDKPLPLASFSNLRSIELFNPHFLPSVITAIRGMLQGSSATLESLTIAPHDWNPNPYWIQSGTTKVIQVVALERFLAGSDVVPTVEVETKPTTSFLSKLIRGRRKTAPDLLTIVPAPAQYPKLREIVINSNRVSLSSVVVPHIPAITHLKSTDNSSGNVDDSFWKALTRERIRMEFLKIHPPTRSLVQYLQSFSGLKTLYIRDPEDGEPVPAKGEAERLLTVVLPRQTLEGLWLEGPRNRGYDLTEERLRGVLSCHGLQSLWISYYFFPRAKVYRGRGGEYANCPDQASIDLGTLFSRLASSLRGLRILSLNPTHKIPHFGCGTGRMGYLRCFKQNFINAISEPTIEGVTPSFTIKVRGPLNDDITLDFDKETRRFVVAWDGEKEARRHWPH